MRTRNMKGCKTPPYYARKELCTMNAEIRVSNQRKKTRRAKMEEKHRKDRFPDVSPQLPRGNIANGRGWENKGRKSYLKTPIPRKGDKR